MSVPPGSLPAGAGKAETLRRLADAGLPVPPFVVIAPSVREDFLAALGPPATAERIRAAGWPAPAHDAVRAALADLPAGSTLVAVRSSMAGEDGRRASFAGQLESFLNLPYDPTGEAAELLAAIQACWASACAPRVEAYRRQQGLTDAAPAVAVIVQRMVDASCAGVVFTADPVTGSRAEMVVSVAPGLGADLVQGAVAGETLRLDRATGETRTPAGLLSPAQLHALWTLAGRVEDLFGEPQDLEFAFDGEQLALLQARPITTPVAADSAATDSSGTERRLWDNANITESYAGVTAPLTFSVIRRAYAGVYRQFLGLMGVREPDEQVLSQLLGCYHGQVYYQLDSWYAALAMLPAFEHNRAFMEQMMGVKQSAGADAPRRSGGRLRLLAWGWRVWRLHRGSETLIADFRRDVSADLVDLAARDLDLLTPGELHGVYLDLERRVLDRWRAPIVTDFFAMVFFGLLRQLAQRWLPDAPLVHNDLLVAGGVESLAPVARVAELAAQVRASPALGAAFALPDAADTLARLRTAPELAAFGAELEDYLRQYGDRCMNELKLEEPNLRDDPARLVRLIAAAARSPAVRPTGTAAARRQAAEELVARLSWWRRTALGWVARHARRYVGAREDLRFVRSRVFGQLRRLFNAVGGRYVAAGLLAGREDVYFLTVDEVWDIVTGTAITLDLRGLVALRRREHATFEQEQWPERFETFGLPYLGQPRVLRRPATAGAPEGGAADPPDLRGTGCCAGRVTGRVRVVRSAEEVSDAGGDVLVAERTDPGWVFLFPTAAALLVERGSPLSHSAIVARELGLPTVVNIPELTRCLRTGDEVELDGRSGEVWLRRRAGTP